MGANACESDDAQRAGSSGQRRDREISDYDVVTFNVLQRLLPARGQGSVPDACHRNDGIVKEYADVESDYPFRFIDENRDIHRASGADQHIAWNGDRYLGAGIASGLLKKNSPLR